MTRHRRAGVNWAKRASAAHRHRVNMRETDERDVGGQRIDLEALLAAPAENYPVDVEEFRELARRWLTRAA